MRSARTALGAGAAVIVLAGAGVGAWQATTGAGPEYRVGVASRQTIRQTLDLSGTVAPLHQAGVAFQVAGTVNSVKVKAGQHVTAGQVIATLDTSSLSETVTSAKDALAAAKITLSDNEAGQSAGGVAGGGTGGSTGGSAATGLSGATTAAAVAGAASSRASAVLTALTTSGPSSTSPSTVPGSHGKSGGSGKGGSGSGSGPPGTGGGSGSGSTGLKRDQQAVVAAQRTADADQQKAAVRLSDAGAACKDAGGGTPPAAGDSGSGGSGSGGSGSGGSGSGGSGSGGSGSGGPGRGAPGATSSTSTSTTTSGATSTTTDPSTTTTTTPPATTTTGASGACAAALQTALAAEDQVRSDEAAVSDSEQHLAEALARLASSASKSSTGGTGASGRGVSSVGGSAPGSRTTTGNSGVKGSGSSGAASSRSSTPSAAVDSAQQLASDQATIDTDEADLVTARAELAAARLVSPLAGTVATVGIAAGQHVSTRSSSSAVTIINTDTYQASGTLTSTQAAAVAVGDGVLVAAEGTPGTLSGRVTSVGPPTGSSGSFSYPVEAAVDSGAKLYAGADATLTIVLRQVTDAVAVPTSAVHTTGAGSSYVEVLSKGRLVEQRVTVGAVGASYTEVTSGLEDGTRVVLADLDAPLPSSSTASTGFGGAAFAFRARSGGFPGGGFTSRAVPGG